MRLRGQSQLDRNLRLLFELLVSRVAEPGRLLEQFPPSIVPELCRLAVTHKVAQVFASRLLCDGGSLTGAAAATVRECAEPATALRRVRAGQLVELFEAAPAPLLHVKGFAVETWSAGPYPRDANDVDLVVEDMAAGAAVMGRLVERGYRLDGTGWARSTPDGRLNGALAACAAVPGEPARYAEVNVGGFPVTTFTSVPIAVSEGAEVPFGRTRIRVAGRLQSLLVLCAETMLRPLLLRDALDLLHLVEGGGAPEASRDLVRASRAAHLDRALGRLASYALALLPADGEASGRRAWLRDVVAGTRRPLVTPWDPVRRSLVATHGPRRGWHLTTAYVYHRCESWLFERDIGLRAIQRLNRRRDPLAVLTGPGVPVYAVPVHTGPTARLRRIPNVRLVAERGDGSWWLATYAGTPLLVLPAGAYLLSVDCVLDPADAERIGRELAELAAA